jgi:hypothetical protein
MVGVVWTAGGLIDGVLLAEGDLPTKLTKILEFGECFANHSTNHLSSPVQPSPVAGRNQASPNVWAVMG